MKRDIHSPYACVVLPSPLKTSSMKTKKDPPVLDENMLGDLLSALAPIAPPRPKRLKQQILKRAQEEAERSALTDRASQSAAALISTVGFEEGGWVEVIPKIHAKRVYTDGTAESWLVRLEAGAKAPAHDHPAPEECIVLQGSVRYIGGTTLNAGDYEVVQPGHHHTELVSDSGALVFLRYALPLNQYLPL
jgi:quercetin dioxygenase-like cupin family protein